LKFKLFFKLILLVAMIIATPSYTQQTSNNTSNKPTRILFLVDVSSSMMYEWNNDQVRMKAVGELVGAITDSLTAYNNNIDFALRLIGSQYPSQKKVCTDTKMEIPFGTLNGKEQIKHKSKNLKPYGFTPIAYALEQAATYDFPNSDKYNYSIILITDGGESCNGDICAVMTQMINKKISFKPYILSLVKDQDLEKQYACMGTYMNILEPKDMPAAIKKIIEDNSIALNISKDKIKNSSLNPPTKPQAPITPKPKIIPTPNDTLANAVVIKGIKTQLKPTPTKPIDTITAIDIPHLDRIYTNKKLKKYTIILTDRRMPKMPRIPMVEVLKPAPMPTTQPVVTQNTPAKPTNTITSKPAAQSSVKEEKTPGIELPIVNETTPSDKTQLRVRFVSRTGREIFAEPIMEITNKKTKATLKEKRLVAAGTKAISPINITEGLYTIKIGNSEDYTQDITILPNQMNTVTIVVNQASLAFEYEGNKNRPVKEYTALVSNRFSQNRTNTKQPCDTKLPYEPASYHVEVNTMPPSMYFLDLETGVTKVILIPENGTLKISNTNPVGMVELFYQLGDAYKHFKNMNLNGNVAAQQIELLPGNYQIRYTHPSTRKQTVTPFRIISLRDTNLEL
jgi:hypothetical protein